MENEKLQKIRHSLAHLLAAAVEKRYPDAKRTLGPAIENGFYYDFEFSTPISDKELPKIEKEMRKILKTWKSFEKIAVDEDGGAGGRGRIVYTETAGGSDNATIDFGVDGKFGTADDIWVSGTYTGATDALKMTAFITDHTALYGWPPPPVLQAIVLFTPWGKSLLKLLSPSFLGSISMTKRPLISPVAIPILAFGQQFSHQKVILECWREAFFTPWLVRGCFPGLLHIAFPQLHLPFSRWCSGIRCQPRLAYLSAEAKSLFL